MKKGYSFFLLMLLGVGAIKAQVPLVDTLKIMSYNVDNYGLYNAQNCPTQTPVVKSPYLRTVLKYTNPDVVGLEKMEASTEKFYTDTIPAEILDSVCNGCWSYGAYTNKSGYYKEDMLYFKTSKFGIISTTVIYSGDQNVSDIDLYKLYYKSSTLSSTHDTVYLNVVLVHIASGSSDSSERAQDIGGAMSWLNSHITKPGNYIIMGDFNVQDATEQCYQDMINPSNSNVKFYDPVNEVGNWSEHPTSYANFLTQSTRTTDPGDCSATGGLNNRFDQILCTSPIISGTDSLTYINGSYVVIGQDGEHVGVAVSGPPTNTSVPSNVLTALYQMSEHLPVELNLAVDAGITTGIMGQGQSSAAFKYNSVVSDELDLQPVNTNLNGQSEMLNIYDLAGRLVQSTSFNLSISNKFYLSSLSRGMYIFSITHNYYPVYNGKFVKL